LVLVAIDAGTTGVRCMLVKPDSVPISISRRNWDYITPQDFEIAKEFNPDHFWHLICTVVKEAIRTSKVNPSDLEGVATTSQRHGSVFLDDVGKEVYAGPNIDSR
jgi:sugar (pentulose or hexulose) kinase